MAEKFAVYVVLIEDTADADMDLSEQVLAMERLGGDMTWAAAEDVIAHTPVANTDIAR